MSVQHSMSPVPASSSPSKKRKHETQGHESTKKKRKQAQAQDAVEVVQNLENDVTVEESPKKQKKRPHDPTILSEHSQSEHPHRETMQIKKRSKKPRDEGTDTDLEAEPASQTDKTIAQSAEDTLSNGMQEREKKRRKPKARLSNNDLEPVREPASDTSDSSVLSKDPSVEPMEDIEMQDWTYMDSRLLDSEAPSCFYSKRLSLLVPISAIGFSTVTSSLLSSHLAPTLLTYFPPAEGIILAFSDPVLSARAGPTVNMPLPPPASGETGAGGEDVSTVVGDEFGVCWVWLTATFLVFKPQREDELLGWGNVSSEGFIGLVSYNYFQTAVGKSRIPGAWKWNSPAGPPNANSRKKGRKGKLGESHSSPVPLDAGNEEAHATANSGHVEEDVGYFSNANGEKLEETLRFKILDTEMIPAAEREKWSLHIEGTLLDEDEEKKVLEEERARFESGQLARSRSQTPGKSSNEPVMSGGLQREASVGSSGSARPAPKRHRVAY